MYRNTGPKESCISLHSGFVANYFSDEVSESQVQPGKLIHPQLAGHRGSQFLISALSSDANGWLPCSNSGQKQSVQWCHHCSSLGKVDNTCLGFCSLVRHNKIKRTRASRITENKPATDIINTLPDELLCQILCFLPAARDQSACASVCKHWLMLQSHICREDFKCRNNDRKVSIGSERKSKGQLEMENVSSGSDAGAYDFLDGVVCQRDLSRSLTGKRATDVRLAAIAVGTEARGGLGKLSIQGGSSPGLKVGITDMGLSAIGKRCTSLRVLSLWDCPYITDEGLSAIGKHCRLLEKVDISKCPLLKDSGLMSIANNCTWLSSLSIDDCKAVGDKSVVTISESSSNLLVLNIRNCPLLSDDGLMAALPNLKTIKRLKLAGLCISDKSIGVIGSCQSLRWLTLSNLHQVTSEGFRVLAMSPSMQFLKNLHVASCENFTDHAVSALDKSHCGVKSVTLAKCENITDEGLVHLTEHAIAMQILHLERCNRITGMGLVTALFKRNGGLREVSVVKCNNIGKVNPCCLPSIPSYLPPLESICLANCSGVGDLCLAILGWLAPQATKLDLTGLTDITDEGLMAFLSSAAYHKLTSVKLGGCTKLTDRSVCAMVHQCGHSLRNLILDGCELVSDKSLKAMANCCSVLEDLDVSDCNISNEGLMPLVTSIGWTFLSLNISGCEGITDDIFPLIQYNCDGLLDLNLKNCTGLSEGALRDCESRMEKCTMFY